MGRFVLLCFLLIAFKEAQGQATRVTKCLRSNGPLPIHTQVVGCINPPCAFPQSEDAVINVVFQAPYLLHNLTTKALVIVKLGIIPIEANYDLGPKANTCNFLTNSSCPIPANEVVEYTLNMFIESYLPTNTVATVELRVEDNKNRPVWCFRATAKVTKPRSQADINRRAEIAKR